MSIQHRKLTTIIDPRAEDPVSHHLATAVLPKEGIELRLPQFTRIALNKKKTVYLYRENKSGLCLVCKFFGNRHELSPLDRKKSLDHEFSSLHNLRNMGFCGHPHQAVRPIEKNERINCMLVEDFAGGRDLDYFFKKAAYEGKNEQLERTLIVLAGFLARLNNQGAGNNDVDFEWLSEYFGQIRHKLLADGIMSLKTGIELDQLCREWERDPAMHETPSVLVHGDATPTNFIFDHEDGLTAIDLERMRLADPVYDLGFIAAELRHHFAWRILKADAAEPFITNFFRVYSEQFPDPRFIFEKITHRNRFYMALGELRIARNRWLSQGHRKWLVEEAVSCLRI
ncbi:MAG: aminoglycoside phosphotransferase family protein [Thermodesulfobacteriota bacterium]|nr:aminoglycoside phosphotransferase family protein [Thermodesulfobacteriota bacterium]